MMKNTAFRYICEIIEKTIVVFYVYHTTESSDNKLWYDQGKVGFNWGVGVGISFNSNSISWLVELEWLDELKFCCWKLCACGHWVNILQHKSYVPLPGLSLDILKIESWTHMGRTANMIIKDVIHVFASISKIMRILLLGRRNCERCLHVLQ